MGGGWSTPRPGRFIPEKDPVPIVQEAGWVPGPVWTAAENLASTGIRSPDRPARSESLYRLSYSGSPVKYSVPKIIQNSALLRQYCGTPTPQVRMTHSSLVFCSPNYKILCSLRRSLYSCFHGTRRFVMMDVQYGLYTTIRRFLLYRQMCHSCSPCVHGNCAIHPAPNMSVIGCCHRRHTDFTDFNKQNPTEQLHIIYNEE